MELRNQLNVSWPRIGYFKELLMAKIIKEQINPKNDIVEAIDSQVFPNPNREYMGYSESGSPCKRKTWYNFHWVQEEDISARTMRIFETGTLAEEFMMASLEHAGFKLQDRQKEVIGGYGHVKGHIDGVTFVGNECYLVEFKTANDKNFKNIVKLGVKRAKPDYYGQITAYLGKFNLEKCLFMTYNKNDSSYYIELVTFNPSHFEEIERMWMDILTAEWPPDKIGDRTWFECKYCNFKKICHEGKMPAQNCRTCQHHNIEDDGKWACSILGDLPVAVQRVGCDMYQLNTYLIVPELEELL